MKKRVLAWAIVASILAVIPRTTYSGSLQNKELQTEFQTLIRGFEGRGGICARTASRTACVNPDERFALQSVMKLLVSLAVMDRVDQGGWRLDEPIVVHKEDLSLQWEAIADVDFFADSSVASGFRASMTKYIGMRVLRFLFLNTVLVSGSSNLWTCNP